MQVKVLRFRMHNAASGLWPQNVRTNDLGNSAMCWYLDLSRFLHRIYSLHYHVSAYAK